MADYNKIDPPPTIVDDLSNYTWKTWFNSIYDYLSLNKYISHNTTSTATTADRESVLIVTSNVTITLPVAADSEDRTYYIKRVTSSGAVTISSSDNIDGASSVSLAANYDAIQVFCDGLTWHIIGRE